jgi:hypothetical protein
MIHKKSGLINWGFSNIGTLIAIIMLTKDNSAKRTNRIDFEILQEQAKRLLNH